MKRINVFNFGTAFLKAENIKIKAVHKLDFGFDVEITQYGKDYVFFQPDPVNQPIGGNYCIYFRPDSWDKKTFIDLCDL